MLWSKREKMLFGCVVVLVGITLFLLYKQSAQPAEVTFPNVLEEHDEAHNGATEDNEQENSLEKEVVVDIKGAVQSPGVYTLRSGERVADAVEKAGGFLDNADSNKINLAGLLKDEMVIYVPEIGEESVPSSFNTLGENEGKIAINSASSEELQSLQGIGPAKAAAIIAYREEHGAFKSAKDLLNVSGIGEKSLQLIEDDITFD